MGVTYGNERVLKKAQSRADGVTFEQAIEAVKKGRTITRKGWKGENQFVFLIKGIDLQKALGYGYGEYEMEPTVVSALAVKTTSNKIQVGWSASQTDILSDDWEILD